ncbi:MAG: type II toxin-antitoxin system prevent-host-death family antitoxin [Anaerolineales bacterium]
MNVYTYSEARRKLADLLDQAAEKGEVRVRRRDGQVFVIRPAPVTTSPLDVGGVALDLTASEIVSFVHEGRRDYQKDRED